MPNAIEYEVDFGKDGKPVKKRFTIGGILVWGIVAIVLGLTGKSVVLPSILPRLLGK